MDTGQKRCMKPKGWDDSAKWLKLLVESALDAVVTMDSGGRIIGFNPAAEAIFGYSEKEAIGHLVSELLIPPALRSAHEKGLNRFLATGTEAIIGKRVEATGVCANGDTFPIELEVITVNPTKSPVFMAYVRDISERKELALERLQHIGKLHRTLMQTIMAIDKMLEIRDPYTAGHQKRVANLAVSIGRRIGFVEDRLEGLFLGALIHDVGKVAIPGEILSRPGRLQEEDKHYLRTHCLKGYEILKNIDFPWPIAEIALQHHERYDGSGYPQGLLGKNILVESRIVSVADVVEALVSHRPYRPAISLKDALFFLGSHVGKWFDPDAAKACLDLFQSGYKISDVTTLNLEWMKHRG